MDKILFINGMSDRKWINALRRVALSLGESLEIIDHQNAQNDFYNCKLVILDAGAISDNDLNLLVQQIHASNSQARIVVVTSAPDWKEARRMLLIGVNDYVRKVEDDKNILNILHGNAPTLLTRGNLPNV